jgi:hypothetical protein
MPTSYQKQINIDENGKENQRDDHPCCNLGAARAEAVLCGSDFFERFGRSRLIVDIMEKLGMSLYLRAWGFSCML